MRVGVPKEIKSDEYRVGMMPVGAEALTRAGHEVFIETQAGISAVASARAARSGLGRMEKVSRRSLREKSRG